MEMKGCFTSNFENIFIAELADCFQKLRSYIPWRYWCIWKRAFWTSKFDNRTVIYELFNMMISRAPGPLIRLKSAALYLFGNMSNFI